MTDRLLKQQDLEQLLERDMGTKRVHVRTLKAHGCALALIAGEKGGGDDGR